MYQVFTWALTGCQARHTSLARFVSGGQSDSLKRVVRRSAVHDSWDSIGTVQLTCFCSCSTRAALPWGLTALCTS